MNDRIKKQFFDEIATTWEELYNPQTLQRIHAIFNQHLNCLKIPLLDLGSGTGILIPELKSRFSLKNFFLLEADISGIMLKEAIRHHPANGVQYIQADGHDLPLKESQFSSIICFQVFPHFHNKNKVTAELLRTLKPQGYLVILHLMGHEELNIMHQKADYAVQKDRIISAKKLAHQLSEYFRIIQVLEQSDLYLVIAKKTQ